MSVAVKVNMITSVQKKALWGAAKANGLDKDALYDVIESMSGKEHMTELTYVEAAKVLDRINNKESHVMNNQKRTDKGGNPETVKLRKKIYALTEQLGWNDNNERINGFIYKMFKINRIEWLPADKCHKLIEILKKMVAEREI